MSSSGYAAWSVTFGEQPTSTKWNILGSNDSAFNLGTGLEDSVILTRHIAANNVTAGLIASGAVLLGSNAASADQGGINITETDLTFAQVTITVPTGGRSILLQIMIPNGNSTGGSADQVRFYFKEGSTYLNTATFAPASAFGQMQNYSCLITGVTAGSHAYKVAVKRTNGTGSYNLNHTNTAPDITKPVFLVWGL